VLKFEIRRPIIPEFYSRRDASSKEQARHICVCAKTYPPDGESKVWWKRLKKALATMSSNFVNASLLQLQAAAQLSCGGISETATNAALALIEAAEPRNEIEGALAVQMACTHAAAMSVAP
jgi:hypothetical protein